MSHFIVSFNTDYTKEVVEAVKAVPGVRLIGRAGADGTLAPERWSSYLKLEAEIAALERRLDKRLASEERKRWRSLARQRRR